MKTIPFSVPIFKYKVENWNIKKKQLLDLFNNFEHKVVDNVITSPINIKTNILLEKIELFKNEIRIDFTQEEIETAYQDIIKNIEGDKKPQIIIEKPKEIKGVSYN